MVGTLQWHVSPSERVGQYSKRCRGGSVGQSSLFTCEDLNSHPRGLVKM